MCPHAGAFRKLREGRFRRLAYPPQRQQADELKPPGVASQRQLPSGVTCILPALWIITGRKASNSTSGFPEPVARFSGR